MTAAYDVDSPFFHFPTIVGDEEEISHHNHK